MTKSEARLVPMSTMHLFVAAIQICKTWRKKKIIRWSFIEEKKGVILSNCCCHSVRIAGAASPCLSRLYFRCYFIHKLCIKKLTASSPTSTERKRETLLICVVGAIEVVVVAIDVLVVVVDVVVVVVIVTVDVVVVTVDVIVFVVAVDFVVVAAVNVFVVVVAVD